MAKKESPKEHQVAMAALARIRCTCGWVFENHFLRGKTDEDLALECGSEFIRHKESME